MPEQALTVSIVIPAYNEERHLRACLEAVAEQTIQPSEVIVVDNNSTDATVSIAQQYPFVKIIKEKKQGIVFARNAGFDTATGDIIGRIDADTEIPPDWVEHILWFYKDSDHLARYAFTGGTVPQNVRFPRFGSWLQGQIAFRMNRFLLGHYILFGSNMALPRHLWQEVRQHVCKRTDIHEDLDLSIHLHRLKYQITYQATWCVQTHVRRVRSGRDSLWRNLMLWPQTLKVHANRLWRLGWVGAFVLYIGSFLLPVFEWIARRAGRRPLEE